MMPIADSGTSATATRNSTDRRHARNACSAGSVIGGTARSSDARSDGRTSVGSIRSRNARRAEILRKLTKLAPGTSSV